MLIKKFLTVIFLIFIFTFSVFSADYGEISAYSAVVINADTKEILYEKDAYRKRSMASTTKIMTSILAIESGMLSHEITATDHILSEGTSIGLKKGYKLSLEALTYGMMLESGNDAANMCALYLGGSYENFAQMMNIKADKIGMSNTNFVTPSGLDAEGHYSTAYDMAVLGAYCIENPLFRHICSQKSKAVITIEPEITLNFKNHNKLLDSCEGVFGIKTGFTKKSGRCLVTACERDGATLVCVTLNAGDDWNDHIKLYDWCYADLKRKKVNVIDFDSVRVYGSDKESVSVFCDEYVYFFKDSNPDLNTKVYLDRIIYAPIKENDIIGKIVYTKDGKYVGASYIYAGENANASAPTHKEKNPIIDWIKNILKN